MFDPSDRPDVPFCINCGTHHFPEERCDYIIQKCKSCGHECKVPPDVEFLYDNGTTICGQCGTVGAWEFFRKEIQDDSSKGNL